MTTAANIGVAAALRIRDIGNTVATAAYWLELLNETYLETLRSNPTLPFLETSEQTVVVSAGTRGTALATGIWTVNWVYDVTDDYRMIPQEGRGDQWHQDQARSATDIPCTYRVRANTLEVFPLPTVDTTFAYEGVLLPAALATGDTPVWGAAWDSLLLHGMMAKFYLDDGNDKWFTIEQGLYTAAVKDLTNFFLFARTETNVPIRDAFWS
jgi:hypothetical protein